MPRPSDERGFALIGVFLLLVMMLGLTSALTVSGRTEVLVVRNHQSIAQARAAAEAGLNHGVQVVVGYLAARPPASVPDALDALLADPGVLEPQLTLGARIAIPGAAPGVEYAVFLLDEDDPARGEAILLDEDANAANDEDGDPLTDNNRVLVVQAVGYGQNGSLVLLEALVGPELVPAVLVNGDLMVSGNPTVTGASGSVHANGTLTVSGNPDVSGDATASGEYLASGNPTIGGLAAGGAAEREVAAVRASDYRTQADVILTSAGQMTLQDGTVLCDDTGKKGGCNAAYGWSFSASGWSISGNAAADGTVYVEGAATINGNPGSPGNPLQMTIVAEGSIEISGNPNMTPNTSGVFLVTDGDLKISGNVEMASAEGQILVHEQISISGNPELVGQIHVEHTPSVDPLVESNTIGGNATVTYDGTLGSNVYRVSGWREVR